MRTMHVAEEIANSVIHGIGFLLSVAGLVLLIVWAADVSAWAVVGVSIYGTTLMLLYLMSVLCHSLSATRMAKMMELIDCSAIYILIAGTYTPFAFTALRGGWGWSLFGTVWFLAVLGIIITLFSLQRGSLILYLLMGWLVVIAAAPLIRHVPQSAIGWLLAGGIAYTGGVIFFVRKHLFSHALWHSAVLLGSACHFIAVAMVVGR
ncbi:MAG: hemolysin III family protein [Candidatus Peribacteraceae bacterium]|jgi:hemolysin III